MRNGIGRENVIATMNNFFYNRTIKMAVILFQDEDDMADLMVKRRAETKKGAFFISKVLLYQIIDMNRFFLY
jgi:hypothetical protein